MSDPSNDDLLKKILNIEDIINEDSIDEDIDMNHINSDMLTELLKPEEGDEDSLMNLENSHAHFLALANMPGGSDNHIEKTEEFIPHFRNPIEFINYMETVYIKKQFDNNENVFLLKNYKYSKSKVNVLQFLPKTTLSSRIFRGGNVITSIAVKGEMLFSGNNLGIIKRYSCETEFEYETYSNPEIEINNTRNVVCMDISNDKHFLISGYSNGYMALWDIPTAKCKKIIKDVHQDCVVACCFVRTEDKTYEIISSDLQGYVHTVSVSEGFFSTSVEHGQLMKKNVPVFLIEILKYTNDEKKKYSFANNNNSLVVAFGCLEFIIVYQIEPTLKALYRFERPKNKNTYFVPDISFGIGYIPRPSTQEKQDLLGIDFYKPHTLLSVTWDNIVYVHLVPFVNNDNNEEEEEGSALPLINVGHYINSVPILRMGFLSTSIIYLLDKNKKIKVINTSLVSYGAIKYDPITEAAIPNLEEQNLAELEDEIMQEKEILFQTHIPDIVAEKKEGSSQEINKRFKTDTNSKATYNRYLLSQPKTLFILGKRNLHYGKLLNWEQCLSNLQQNSESMPAMSLGLDLFHGRRLALPDIPIDEFERKKKVENVLKGLIIQYALIHTAYDPSPHTKDKNDDEFTKCINTCIEFCIEIQNVELLMTDLLPMFDSKNYGDIFIEKLEPFILCERIGKQQLGNATISKIIEIYMKKNSYQMLSQILIHLDIESIDVDNIKELCSSHHLITPLIYIYMNGNKEDYFYPIKRIYEIFKEAPEIPIGDFVSYADYLKRIGTAQLEQCKPYIGHKLFWYLNQCLNGRKFPNDFPINEDKHQELVLKIALWLLSPEVIETLLRFDSFSFFFIFTILFHEEKLISILEQVTYDIEMSSHVLLNSKPIENIEKITLCNIIIENSFKIGNDFILEDLYHMIAKISPEMKTINKEIIIKACIFLLSQQRKEKDKDKGKDNNNPEDYFGIHTRYCKDDIDNIDTLSNVLIAMIDSREDLTKEDLEILLSKSNISPYINVTLHLLNSVEKYNECLDMFIKDDSIKNRISRTFIWLDETLFLLHSFNKKEISSFKEKIIEKIIKLAELSIEKLFDLITTWFNERHDDVIEKLKGNDNLQLSYIEKNLEIYKEDDLQPEDHPKYENLLTIHMALLFKLKKHNLILDNLQKRQLYPTETILEQCKEQKVYNAALFLYKKIGNTEEAMIFFNNLLKKTFDETILSIQTNQTNDTIYHLLLEHHSNVRRCIEICEINSDKSNSEEESEDMWFKFLQMFYDMLAKIKNCQTPEFKASLNDLAGKITENINEILEKMDSYVRIHKVIENVFGNYQQAEIGEFKNLLGKVLSSYSHSTDILFCVSELLDISLGRILDEYTGLIGKGNYYSLDKCDYCLESFEKNSHNWKMRDLFVFKCGHKAHIECVFSASNRGVTCPTCKNLDEQNGLANKVDLGIDEMKNAATVRRRQTQQMIQREANEQIQIHDNLKNIDKQYFDLINLFNDDK